MANNECYANKNTSSSSSSVCEVSMLLVSNIIRLSCRSLFGGQSKNLPPNYYGSNDEPPLLQDHHHHHERLARVSRKPSAASKIKVTQESADSVRVTKPSSYVLKPSGHDEVGETLTRKETYNNVDAHAGTYINQVRQRINGNHHHVNK